MVPTNPSTLSWLLEHESPGVRYLGLRDLLALEADDPELLAARSSAHRDGPIATVLDAMQPEGYWEKAGPGYNPKYRSTVWAIILLAQLGARIELDERIVTACNYLLAQTLTADGQFTLTGTPSGTIDCLQGNLCWALRSLGCDDPRLDVAFEWMARTVIGEGLAPLEDERAPLRYYAGKCGPNFACGANNSLACAWGGTKVMLAFGMLAVEERTPLIESAIRQGIDFFLSVDPATADYPNGWADKPSRNWWKFGFPVFYVTDLLQIVEALNALGFGQDPRLENALNIIRAKQDSQGRWALEYDYRGKTWVDFGPKKAPNKWVTLRAMRALQAASVPSELHQQE
jgi:hypothetical protein